MPQKPKWWLLYAIFPLSAGLLWLDGQLILPPQEHQLLEMGIVLVSFGLMALWARANQRVVVENSAPHIVYFPPPDPKRRQPLDLAADRHNSLYSDADEPMLVDFKGKYN